MVVLSQYQTAENGSIVLIGPTGVGKSAVGKELAALLDWRLIELDDLRSEWYPEFGLDPDVERSAMAQGGLAELVKAWKPYELLSVQRVMKENPTNTVIAFGGGQSVYVDPQQIEQAKAALAVASRVILLLPSDHGEESMRILQQRLQDVPEVQQQKNPEEFVRAFSPLLKMQLQSESNSQLATEMIVTGGSSPQELARHILATQGPVDE